MTVDHIRVGQMNQRRRVLGPTAAVRRFTVDSAGHSSSMSRWANQSPVEGPGGTSRSRMCSAELETIWSRANPSRFTGHDLVKES